MTLSGYTNRAQFPGGGGSGGGGGCVGGIGMSLL